MPTKQPQLRSDKPSARRDGFSSKKYKSRLRRGELARRWAPLSAFGSEIPGTNRAEFLAPHCATQRHSVKTNIVDVPRYTLTALRDQCESCGCKQLGAVVSGHLEPVIDVPKSLRSRQTLQASHNGNALTQLGQARTHQPVRQFRLTGKDDLEQFSVCRLKVGKQTHGLQHGV